MRDIYRKEGLKAFMKGADALGFRLGTQNIVMFVTLEQIKKWYISSCAEEKELALH